MSKTEVGKRGEDIACEYLLKNGYEIIERNKHFSRYCEIDIIAKRKDTLVFVEVKTRKTNSCGSPFEAITPKKYENIKTGLYTYISQLPQTKVNYQIDAIAITLYPELKIDHLANI